MFSSCAWTYLSSLKQSQIQKKSSFGNQRIAANLRKCELSTSYSQQQIFYCKSFLAHLVQAVLYDSKTYFCLKIKIYQYTQFCFIYFLNVTILFACRTWLLILDIKYSGTNKVVQYMAVSCFFFIGVNAILLSVQIFYLTSAELLHLPILILTSIVGLIFIYSALLFRKNILTMHVIPGSMRNLMKFVAVGVIISSLVRFTWDLLQSMKFSSDYIDELKDYDESKMQDKGWFWQNNFNRINRFYYLVPYVLIVDYFPIILIATLYCPDISKKPDTSLIQSNYDVQGTDRDTSEGTSQRN